MSLPHPKILRVVCSVLLLLLGVFHSPRLARGELVLGLIGDTVWDRVEQPAGSPLITFSILPGGSATPPNALNAFNLGLRIVPMAGAVGRLEIGSVSPSLENSVFDAFNPPPFVSFPAPDVPTVNGSRQTFSNVEASAQRNLFDLQFVSPASDALGTFEIYAVPEFSNYFTTSEFDGYKYGNVPIGPDVTLGSIRITAVPEPSSMVLLALTLASLLGRRHRLRFK